MGVEVLELTYRLHELPSAQHKAGLAGLLVLMDTLAKRRKRPLPEVAGLSAGGVQIRLTAASLHAVFDELYGASVEEVQVTKKWAGRTPLREVAVGVVDPRTGRSREVRQFVYGQTVPRAEFLSSLGLPAPWLKLWREAVWSTLRGIPRTRLPYEERLRGRPTALGVDAWAKLRQWRERTAEGRAYAVDLSGALFVGAQARTAEEVPFRGGVPETLLLHFWPVVMTCWVPEVLRLEKTGRQVRVARHQVGYVLAVPEVADLEEFVQTFPGLVHNLPRETIGFRPRSSLISLPEEGALEFLSHLVSIARAQAARSEDRWSVHAVEVYHVQKLGNTIPILHAGRVPMDRGMLERYELVRDLKHPLLKAQLIRNVLHKEPWYRGFGRVMSMHPSELFFQGDFCGQVAQAFSRGRPLNKEAV